MTQILVRLDNELVQEVRKLIEKRYGGKRGSLSLLVEEALRKALSPPAEISTSSLLELIDYISRASKEGRSKDEILTNVFIMLDREFEQSIIRGTEDMKQRRAKQVPSEKDPLEFLRELASKI
jgi:metal-responsive CopG/Arc/MetJ family transcriptional regulator